MSDLKNSPSDVIVRVGENKFYSYDDAVELTGHGRYNYMLLAACSVISNAMALDMFGFSVVVAAATCDLQLGLTETGMLASTPFAGILFAYPWGYFADTRGRRLALLLSTSVGFTMAALSSFSPSWQVMMALKVVGCSFSSAAFTLTMTYLGECVGSQYRSPYLFIMNSANMAAEIVFFSLAYFLLPLTFNIPVPWLGISLRPWRLYTFILATPLGLGAVMMFFLYESPKFLANRGKGDKALEVLKKIYKINGSKNGEYPVKMLSIDNYEDLASESFWSSIVKQTVPLFKPPLLWRTLQLFFLMAICCSTNNIFLMWYPTVVNLFFNSLADGISNEAGFCERVIANISTSVDADNFICNDVISTNTIYSGIILGVVFVSLNLLAATVAAWRRLVLIGTFLISTTSLLLVNLMSNPFVILILFTLVQITAIGICCVASYFVDLYPTSYRGLATSLSAMGSRLVALSGVNLVGVVIVNHCHLTFYGFAVYVMCGVVAAIFLPSDKQKSEKQVND